MINLPSPNGQTQYINPANLVRANSVSRTVDGLASTETRIFHNGDSNKPDIITGLTSQQVANRAGLFAAFTPGAFRANLVPGARVVRIQGIAPDIDNNDVPQTIWPEDDNRAGVDSGYNCFPEGTVNLELVSTSANDAAAGTGAQIVEVIALNDDGNPVRNNIVPNGTTRVAIPGGPYRRVNRMRVLRAGSGETNAGDISVRSTVADGDDFFDVIPGAGANLNEAPSISQSAKATVPAGRTLFIIDWTVGSRSNVSGGLVTEFEISVRVNDENWQRQYRRVIAEVATRGQGLSGTTRNLNGFIAVPERCDLEVILSRTSGNNARPFTVITGLLVNDVLAGPGDGEF